MRHHLNEVVFHKFYVVELHYDGILNGLMLVLRNIKDYKPSLKEMINFFIRYIIILTLNKYSVRKYYALVKTLLRLRR